jgi:hypothetical protein
MRAHGSLPSTYISELRCLLKRRLPSLEEIPWKASPPSPRCCATR